MFRKYSGEWASDVHVSWGSRGQAQASFLLGTGSWKAQQEPRNRSSAQERGGHERDGRSKGTRKSWGCVPHEIGKWSRGKACDLSSKSPSATGAETEVGKVRGCPRVRTRQSPEQSQALGDGVDQPREPG